MTVAYIVHLPNPEDIICSACMRWHEPPQCHHDSTRACRRCGAPVGYKASENQPSDTCWRCFDAAA